MRHRMLNKCFRVALCGALILGASARSPAAEVPETDNTQTGLSTQDASLRGNYYTAVQKAISMNWLRPESAMPGIRCNIRIMQAPGGKVLSATVTGPCNADVQTRKSIEQAVKLAEPLPYKGYAKVFKRQLIFNFTYGGTPEVVAYGPFKMTLLSAEDEAGEYYSVVAKATFVIDSKGNLAIVKRGGEPLIGTSTDAAHDFECGEYGAGFNQRTAWFPYTAIFVSGGALETVESATGTSQRVRALSPYNIDELTYQDSDARQTEYSYVPCVGTRRVQAGARLDSYLAADDQLTIRAATGQHVRLVLPQPFVPWVLARYEKGEMIPVPMRIVLATVDLVEHRVVLQLQTTIARLPPLRKLEVRAVLKDGRPSEGETMQRYQERTQALLLDLAACPVPKTLAIEHCADHARHFDPRIFMPMP